MEGVVGRGGAGRGRGGPGRGRGGAGRGRLFIGYRYLRAQELWEITHYPTPTQLMLWAGYCGVTYRQLQQWFQRYRRRDRLAAEAAAAAAPVDGGIVHQPPPQGLEWFDEVPPIYDFDIGNFFADFPFADEGAPQPPPQP